VPQSGALSGLAAGWAAFVRYSSVSLSVACSLTGGLQLYGNVQAS
jgi:hypothetical protein